MKEFGRIQFEEVFSVGQVVPSGAGPNRKNAAHLKITEIEDDAFRYKPERSKSPHRMRYDYLQLVIDSFESNPKSIQRSVNAGLKKADFNPNYSTENYAYSFAKAFHDFHEKQRSELFLSTGESLSAADTASEAILYLEGQRVAVMVERIERSWKARTDCIARHGTACKICGFNFKTHYGEIGESFIHVHHHRDRLADTQGEHEIHPIEDLIPICPNCHAMIHSKQKMLTVDELRSIWDDHNPKP